MSNHSWNSLRHNRTHAQGLVVVCMVAISCHGKAQSQMEQFTADSNGCKIVYSGYRVRADSIVRDGHYTKCMADGQKIEDGWYRDGLKDSVWTTSFPAKDTVTKEAWKEGRRNGRHEKRFKGYLGEEGLFVNDLKEGKWKLGFGSQNLQEGDFLHDLKNGMWIEKVEQTREMYYEYSGSYVGGFRQGVWTLKHVRWDGAAKRKKELIYDKGAIVKETNWTNVKEP